MLSYDGLPGIELSIQDRGLTLPREQANTKSVLIIAPITESPLNALYTQDEYTPVKITGQSDFEKFDMGVYGTSNPLSRLWKQVYDAGCRDIRAIKLKGSTNAERYGHLHDIYYVLQENTDVDIIVVGGIYADDSVTGTPSFFYTTKEDYAGENKVMNEDATSVAAETIATTNGEATAYTLANNPVAANTLVLSLVTPGTIAVHDTGNITSLNASDSTGKTLVFKGCTATLKSGATAVTAVASTNTVGGATIQNTTGATAASVTSSVIAAFDFSGANAKTFTVSVSGGAAQTVTLDSNVTNIAGLVTAIDDDLDGTVAVTEVAGAVKIATVGTGAAVSLVIAGTDASFFFSTLTATGSAAVTLDAAATAAGYKAIFDKIKAKAGSVLAGYTFTASGAKLIIQGNSEIGDSDNAMLISGTATIVNVLIADQLTTPGVDETAVYVPTTSYTLNALTGAITFGDAPLAGYMLRASYKHYAYNFASQFGGFLETIGTNNKQIEGVIALKPSSDNSIASIKTYVNDQLNQKYSKYLEVVGGSTLYFTMGPSVYEDIFAGAYAGMLSVLPSMSSPMAKAISGAVKAPYTLSPNQITGLINKHIIVPRLKNGNLVVADAITTADDDSDYVRVTTLRIMNDVVQLTREIAEPYIGEPNTPARRNSLETAIRSGLTAMVNMGALNDFRFYIKSTIADQIDGKMRINLEIVPVFETRRIYLSVAVKPSL